MVAESSEQGQLFFVESGAGCWAIASTDKSINTFKLKLKTWRTNSLQLGLNINTSVKRTTSFFLMSGLLVLCFVPLIFRNRNGVDEFRNVLHIWGYFSISHDISGSYLGYVPSSCIQESSSIHLTIDKSYSMAVMINPWWWNCEPLFLQKITKNHVAQVESYSCIPHISVGIVDSPLQLYCI